MSNRNKKFKDVIRHNLDGLIFKDTVNNSDNALILNNTWTITDSSKALVDEFFENDFLPWFLSPGQRLLKRVDKLKQFYCFLANLKLAFPIRPLRLSLHTNEYTKDPFFSTFIIDIFNWLEYEKFVFVRRGYSPADNSVGQQTRTSPTAKLREKILSNIEIARVSNTNSKDDVIVLRNSEKENILFEDTQEIIDLRRRIENINTVNGKHHVVFFYQKDIGLISTRLHAVFNNCSFNDNGRFYTGSLGFQSLPKKIRKTILIDGKKTIERDYSAHHPRILYSLNLINYVDNPYEIVFQNSDDEMIKILKIVFLVLINAGGHGETVQGCFKEFRKRPSIFPFLKKKSLRITDLITACRTAHKDIETSFSSSQGIRLSNIDSKIALQVVEHFTSQGKACLSVHDSFIVRNEDDQELIGTMKRIYSEVLQQQTNSDMEFSCIVK